MSIVLVTTACGTSAPTAGPTDPPVGQSSPPGQTTLPTTPPGSPGALPTLDPAATPEPEAPPEPLPAPELLSTDEIAEALFTPVFAEQAVVSMLDALDIGIYNPDGTPIRTGTEASDADFYMFEPEVRGLIAMLEEQDQPENYITFRDFHGAVAAMGYEGSVEELAAIYSDAYAAAPDEPIARFVNAVAFIDPEASFTRFGAWLLLLDGFVPPHGESGQAARATRAGSGVALASQPPRRGGWGLAMDRRRRGSNLPPMNVDPVVVQRLTALASHFSILVVARPGRVHEGHGGSGSPSEVTAQVTATAGAFVSPFTNGTVVPVNRNPTDGLPITWRPDDVMNRHGSAAPLSGTTSVLGATTTIFTPKSEKANGQGDLITELATVTASVPAMELIWALYEGIPDLRALIPGEVSGEARLVVEWHAEVMEVELINRYNVSWLTGFGDAHQSGTDTFTGRLARLDEDSDTWVGFLDATAVGNFNGFAFGQQGCSVGWNASQKVVVEGKSIPNQGRGDFAFTFYPATAPVGLPSGRCQPTLYKSRGLYYLPFNDLRVTTPDVVGGLIVTLPSRPGGTTIYPVPSLPPQYSTKVRDTEWEVTITFPNP